ncbi:MAG TPA: crossover junction endodeoxyribonuclease RuvC [Microscillaceae bacterium]|jgi:crossover junction endodeoxyribonuclease RuvC|nr:crossover junction endodeoxyribonuclease RuvC [Microscillaceae bacterium]
MADPTVDKVILGVDPGTRLLGYGLLGVKGTKMYLIQHGVIHLAKYKSHALKLQKIFLKLTQLIEAYSPDEMALESPFYGQNIQVALKLGRAQGVAMAAALVKDIPIVEYAPRKIKQSVTGNGNASKEQVAAMLGKLLMFDHTQSEALDATDALGVAVCHHFQGSSKTQGKHKSWAAFLKENPDRLQ